MPVSVASFRAGDSLGRGWDRWRRKWARRLQAHIRDPYLVGKALNRRTGRLWRSISFRLIRKFGFELFTNVPYGARWEYGKGGSFQRNTPLDRVTLGEDARSFIAPSFKDLQEPMVKDYERTAQKQLDRIPDREFRMELRI